MATKCGRKYVILYTVNQYMTGGTAMPVVVSPAEKQEITKIICPYCSEKVRFVGLLKDSKIDGLTFKCKRCGKFWKVKTE